MLNWNQTDTAYSAVANTTNLRETCNAVENLAEQAIRLLADNIQDDTLYLLFEWDKNLACLSAVVTDSTKTQDGPIRVAVSFPAMLNNRTEIEGLESDPSEQIHFWLHDYLTTCSAFFSYSLVAIFHSSTRSETSLL